MQICSKFETSPSAANHKIFSKLKIDSEWAHLISFVELIGFPTTGMAKSSNKKFMEYLMSDENKSHLIVLSLNLSTAFSLLPLLLHWDYIALDLGSLLTPYI